jgi:bifunctional DNase/RNase
MKKVPLDIVALSHSVTQSHNYAVVLGEQGGVRRLPIVIGGFEAQAMERMTPNRPLTHDLFKDTLETFDIQLREVVINNLLDGIFYARLICVKDGEEIEIDSRTSDALAMAVRFECPIYTYGFILDAAGVILEDNEDAIDTTKPVKKTTTKAEVKSVVGLSGHSIEELQSMLNEVLAQEDYEKAAEIRDEIQKRNG